MIPFIGMGAMSAEANDDRQITRHKQWTPHAHRPWNISLEPVQQIARDCDTQEEIDICYNCQYLDCIVPDSTMKHCMDLTPQEIQQYANRTVKKYVRETTLAECIAAGCSDRTLARKLGVDLHVAVERRMRYEKKQQQMEENT